MPKNNDLPLELLKCLAALLRYSYFWFWLYLNSGSVATSGLTCTLSGKNLRLGWLNRINIG